jgi:hypothetical protein
MNRASGERYEPGQSSAGVVHHTLAIKVKPFGGTLKVIANFIFVEVVFAHCELLEINFKRAWRFGYHRWLKAVNEFPTAIDTLCIATIHLQNPHGGIPIEGSAFGLEGSSDIDMRFRHISI